MLPCPPLVWKDMGQCCQKPMGYKTGVYDSYQASARLNYMDASICEGYSKNVFTEKCDPGYSRTGAVGCIMDYLSGWPDEGSFCEKRGTGTGQIPFPWVPGDGKSERVLKKEPVKKYKKGKKGKGKRGIKDKKD